jgi:lysophospholipase
MVFLSFVVQILLVASLVMADSPTGGYAPGTIDCPSENSLVRVANGLSQNETNFITERQKLTDAALIDFLNRQNMTDFDAQSFLSNTSLTIGIAFSGGGYRAMLAGAGEFSALDNRTTNSTNAHNLGGLLQATTYFSGLSGGNWLLGSIVFNNFSSIPALQDSDTVWDLEHSIFNPGGANIFSTASYWNDLVDDVHAKENAGFNTSITDIWGRALSHQFVNLTNGGPGLTLDDVRNYDVFQTHQMPFPIIVADGRAPNTTILNTNSTVFEFTPFELGSWDPSLYAFTDVKYLGTQVSNGVPNGTCYAGFDNAGFTMGTSSSLFNQFILQLNSTGLSGVVYDLALDLLTDLGTDNDDIAIYDPNPFANISTVNNSIANASYLSLVDGGEDGQNIPLVPLIQPLRKVDVVFAFDNSADTTFSWPNGTSMVATYERQFGSEGNNTIFPYVPDQTTFINLGLTKRPTFFGCNASNLTTLFNSSQPESDRFVPPLIVYIANAPYSFFSNTSTFQLSYDTEEVDGIIQNGYNVVTQANGTVDSEWTACVGCAIIQRELERRGQAPSQQCQNCFNKYCWDGTISTAAVNQTDIDPTLSVKSPASRVYWSLWSVIASVVAVLFMFR